MAEHPLEIFEKLDPELLNLVENTRELALADGALPKPDKLEHVSLVVLKAVFWLIYNIICQEKWTDPPPPPHLETKT
jgi:hypothetical protein